MRKTIQLIAAFLLISQTLFANQKYFDEVKKVTKSYRVETSFENMQVVKDEKGKDVFYITLASNRNNFEMVMLVGYIAAGQAMKSGFQPSSVFVTVDVPLGEGFRLLTTATKEDLQQLLSGKITTKTFVRRVKYI
ncbi:MAG: hypothetical protein CMG71_05555 [Candidatus Marinimicrobia bacterium]|nr:hypothetical protein [Candidatus Neomarinimicrobiota bacterium]